MAFHDRLSNTQRILLAIFCFPLLPFYFCALCYARSHEEQEEGKPTELAHMEAGKTVETQRDSSFTERGLELQPSEYELWRKEIPRVGTADPVLVILLAK